MTDWNELIRREPDPVRRAHFRKLMAGPEALVKFTTKDESKRLERERLVQEVSRIGRENRRRMAADAPAEEEAPAVFTDSEMRDFIKESTGRAPHPRTSREKLLETVERLTSRDD